MTIKKIAFIDYFLDEWHANNYPQWIRDNISKNGRRMELAYAWAEIDKPGGLNTAQWCNQHQIELISSIEEIVQKADCFLVLSPDYPEHHERLAEAVLRSGKPVYIDKTFSPDIDSGKRMFALAQSCNTPMFSSSALRFAAELAQWHKNPGIEMVSVTGPGEFSNYAVHAFEMINTVMGEGIKRLKSLSSDQSRLFVLEYKDGRQATMQQAGELPFQMHMQLKDGSTIHIGEMSAFFERMIDSILQFFKTTEVPVAPSETLEVMALIEVGRKALQRRDEWLDIETQ